MKESQKRLKRPTNIVLPPDLKIAAQRYAETNDTSLSKLVRDFLRERLIAAGEIDEHGKLKAQ